MRIALCIEYPIGQSGGTEVLVTELTRGFQRHHEVILVSPDDAASLARSPIGPMLAGQVNWRSQPATSARARQLAERLAGERIDLAHFHLGGYFGWGNRYPNRCPIPHLARRGVPCVSTVHLVVSVLDGFGPKQGSLLYKLLMLPLAWSGKADQLRHVATEIAVSGHDHDKLCRWYRPLRHKFTQIYHSRLREEEVVPVAARKPVILNVGHIAYRKGQEVLVEAFLKVAARYPEWTLQLAGYASNDGAAERIGQMAARQNCTARVQLLGQRDDAFNLMREASIYVQPSREEALGLALQEAMFYGCPAIGSRIGGIPELIDDQRDGFLFASGDAAQLAQQLELLMREETQRQSWGKAAAAAIRAKGMTSERMVQRHLELYDRVAGSSARLPRPARLL